MKARVFTTNKLIYSRVSGHLPINILPLLEILVLGVWVWHVVVFVLLAPPTADVASREASTQGLPGLLQPQRGPRSLRSRRQEAGPLQELQDLKERCDVWKNILQKQC